MTGRQGRAPRSIPGATVGATGMALWDRSRRNRDDTLPHMADEILLTLQNTTGQPLPHGDPRVRQLEQQVHQAVEVWTRHRLSRIQKGPPAHGPVSHLTLRTRVEAPPARSTLPGRSHVMAAADAINSRLGTAALQYQDIQISSAMPNWLVSSAVLVPPGGDGPATLAAPAPSNPDGSEFWPFSVPRAGQAPEPPAKGAGDPPVVVAALDTWPGQWRLNDACARYPNNGLLQRMQSGIRSGTIKIPDLTPPDDVPDLFTHASADHGLFVMGIINSIARHAELHLLHVLNENGHGHAASMLDALDYCLALAQKGRQVVVNLSLYYMIPPADRLLPQRRGPLGGLATGRGIAALKALDEGIRRRIARLLEAGAVVVAAAGNDSLKSQAPLPPRSPANYPDVICAVATDRDGKRASYSNGPGTGFAVAAYGGQAVEAGPRTVVPPGPDPRDGVIGVFAWPDVRLAGYNRTGWAYWSGTSFSTAAISGLAANVLARNPIAASATRASQVLDGIHALGRFDPGLGCHYVHVSQ